MGIKLKGWPAWMAHRGYHGMAMPTFERKFRVVSGWFWSLFFNRDMTQLSDLDNPRRQFVEAATPKPKPAQKPAEVEEKPADAKPAEAAAKPADAKPAEAAA